MLCCGHTLTDFPISIRLTSLALWQSNDCPSASKATLMNMDKYFMWIHYGRLNNHNKAKHNKTMCIFLGIYCMAISKKKSTSNLYIRHTLVGNKLVHHSDVGAALTTSSTEHKASIHWESNCKTTQETFEFFSFGAPYTRDFTVNHSWHHFMNAFLYTAHSSNIVW